MRRIDNAGRRRLVLRRTRRDRSPSGLRRRRRWDPGGRQAEPSSPAPHQEQDARSQAAPSEGTPWAQGSGHPKNIPETAVVLKRRIIARESRLIGSRCPVAQEADQALRAGQRTRSPVPSATSSRSHGMNGSPPAGSEPDFSARGAAAPRRGAAAPRADYSIGPMGRVAIRLAGPPGAALVPDHSPYARRLREIADAVNAECQPNDDALTPHPNTLARHDGGTARRDGKATGQNGLGS